MATFGRTTTTATVSSSGANHLRRVAKFTLASPGGLVSKLTAYVSGDGTSGSQHAKGLIYSDNAGDPYMLQGSASAEVEIAYDAAVAWVDFTFASGVNLAGGDYWLGFINDDTTGDSSISWHGDGTSGDGFVADFDNYATPSDPHDTPAGASTIEFCIYATYEPYIVGTGALQIGSPSLSGAMHMDVTGTGALTAGVEVQGLASPRYLGTGALTAASPALSGRTWMDSAHLRQLGGKAMLWGAKGRAEIWGLKGKASM